MGFTGCPILREPYLREALRLRWFRRHRLRSRNLSRLPRNRRSHWLLRRRLLLSFL
jgi:hypothetical protein